MSESAFKNPFDVIDQDDETCASQFEIPVDVEQALKKISKRGNETRSKGFKELLFSLKLLPKDHLGAVAVLLRSSFVAIFKKYCFEPDKANRLSMAKVFELLLSAAELKNFLAPILKDILMQWLLSMYDPNQDVASTYRKCFEKAFNSANAIEKVLEKFSTLIIAELDSFLKGEKWASLKEITCVDLGSSEEEASAVIELVKTELVGLCMLLNAKSIIILDGFVKLLVQDTSFSPSRRLALYRLYKSSGVQALKSKIIILMKTENASSALSFIIDIENELVETLSESLMASFFANLPEKDFAKLKEVAEKRLEIAIPAIVRFLTANSATTSRDRFMIIWNDLCVPLLKNVSDLKQVKNLLFDAKRPLQVIGPCSPLETMDMLLSCLPSELVKEVTLKNPNSCQKALILSKLNQTDELNICLSNLSLKDLQRPELRDFISPNIIASNLSTSTSSKEFTSLLESLDTSDALEILKKSNFASEEILPFASVKLIGNVLVKAHHKLPINVKTVAAALQIEYCIFDSCHEINQNILDEAMLLAKPDPKSPFLKCLVLCRRFNSLELLSNADELLKNLTMTPDLFIYLNLKNEAYFPIDAFAKDIEESRPSSHDNPAILLFKSQRKVDSNLLALSRLSLTNQENIKSVALWCYLNGVEYTISKSSDIKSYDNWTTFALFKAGLESFDSSTSLGEALNTFTSLKNMSVSELNFKFDQLLFPESEALVSREVLMLSCCLEPLLPIKSDKLAVLISDTKVEFRPLCLYLISLHAQRSDLSREFWQVQWRETVSSWMNFENGINKEISLKAVASLWNILESPEIEMLPLFRNELLHVPVQNSSLVYEESAAAKLFTLAVPFLEVQKSFLLESFRKTCSKSWLLAIRSALLMIVLDESLVAAQARFTAEPNLIEEDCGEIIFPLFDMLPHVEPLKRLVLFELFVSWCEGAKEDSILQAAFHNCFKTALLPHFFPLLQDQTSQEQFDFTPRDFDPQELSEHLLYRLCAQFPLIMAGQMKSIDCAAKLSFREIDRVRRNPFITSENVTIKLRPILTSTTRVISLSVNFAGEIELEICLQLPPQFPLEPVKVEGIKKSGLPEAKWKSALLSLQAIFRSTSFNGNIVEAIRKWQVNALKLFQGLEECPVCYSVVHPSDRSLPGPSCKQCKHRFHASCLYKWFKSSGNSTCPLCRALF